jgi:hypothetical protein
MRKMAIMTLFVLIAGFSAMAQKAQLDIYKTSASPLIDGIEEDVWDLVQPVFIDKNFFVEFPTLTAYWKAIWKDTSIYLLVRVEDDDHYPSWEPQGNQWEYDQIEIYFDVNDILNDGKGPAYSGSGHYQSAPGFTETGYNILHKDDPSFSYPGGNYAYRLDGENYTCEYMIPFSNFIDQYGYIQYKEDFINKEIGFDVTVVDQDEDITTSRQRKVWQNEGNPNPGEESWNNMDACGIIIFRDTIANYYVNDTVLCDSSKSAAIVFAPPGDSIISYTWDPDGGTLLFADTLFSRIRWNESGNKNVRLFIQTQSGDFDTLERNVIIYPKLSVSLGADFEVCNARTFLITPTITNGNKPFQYFWDYKPGDAVYTGSFNSGKTVSLMIKDEKGCLAADALFVSVLDNPDPQPICMVTVDATTNKNKIIWQKSIDKRIGTYQIFKESNVAGQYTQIGTMPVSSESTFTDTTSQPSRYADRYALITTDTCNSHSTLSDPHQPIHLQISQGLPGTYNLSWSPYIGFGYSTYYIYKGKSVNQMELIDELASSKTQYTDTSSGLSYYRVTVRKDDPCMISDKKASDSQYDETGSNVVNTLATEILPIENQMPFQVYPNPFNDELIVEMEIANPHRISIEVYNALGVKIYEYKQEVVAAGNFRHIIHERDIPDISEMNILRLEAGDQTYFLKIIKNK